MPLLQLINSQIIGDGLGVWVGPRMNIKEDDGRGVLQNIPVHPGKHSHMVMSSPTSIQSPFVQLTKSHNEMLAVGDDVGSMGVRNGTSTLSELGTRNKIEDGVGIEIVSPTTKEVIGNGIRISQNSPVHPAKHSHVKFNPESIAIQLPLLQSIISHTSIGGLGDGVRVRIIDDDDTIGTSQNIPVHPRKHSQMAMSSPTSIHSPFVQLMKSHTEILAVGDGVGNTGVGNGTSTLSELGTRNKIEDVGIGIELVSRATKEVIGNCISQNSPVHPTKHSQMAMSSPTSIHSPFVQLTKSHAEMLEMDDGVGSTGVWNGTSTLSELETKNKTEDVEIVSPTTKEVVGNGMSQNSPVHPTKHSHIAMLSPTSIHSPFVQLTKSHAEMLAVGDGVGSTGVWNGTSTLSELGTRNKTEDVGIGIELVSPATIEVVGNGISQNSPVHPTKHSQMAMSSPTSVHSPFVQLTKSHAEMLEVGDGVGSMGVGNGTSTLSELGMRNKTEDVGIGIELGSTATIEVVGNGISQNSPVHPAKHSQMAMSSPTSTHAPFVQLTKSHAEMLAVGDGVGSTGVGNGTSTLSELGTRNKIEDGVGIEIVSPTTKEVIGNGIRTSQNSPVHPAKHSHVKFTPESIATQLPLLQSIISHTSIGGLGEGVRLRIIDDDDTIGTSQNIPVHPRKHSHIAMSPTSIHSPFIQLTKSHAEMLAVGDGVGSTGVGNGTSTLSELGMRNKNEDVGIGIELVSPATIEVVGNGISQNSPVHPTKHSHIAMLSPTSTHSPFVQLTKSHAEMLAVGDGVGSTGVGNGTSTLSELETKIKIGISQNSPVHPAKHSQVKFTPESIATQLPLLQSIISHTSVGGLGDGVRVRIIDDDDTIGTSQNIPVHPRKHSHMTKFPPKSIHTPFMQLTKLHAETLVTVGEGETMIELGVSN